jgi:purine nucleosidase/pyrimidine-specific ribonucleoside hydrolase
VDDDGSPDGVTALLYFLIDPYFDVQAVTVSYGEAHPDLFAGHILQLLAGLGRADIPVGAGEPTPLEGNNAFPDSWRQASDTFWGIVLPPASVKSDSVPAAKLIADTINCSPEPVLVFVSGSHTNLAEALRLNPEIAGNIREVYIMGGSVYEPGNIKSDWPAIDNSLAEWNIWVDPVAAAEVFSSGLPLHLVPLDATGQVIWTQSDVPG